MRGVDSRRRSVSNEKRSWTETYFNTCCENNLSKPLKIKPRALFSDEQTKTVSLSSCSSFENDFSLDECSENRPQHGNINISDSFRDIICKEERGNANGIRFKIDDSFNSPILKGRKLKTPPAPKKKKKKSFFII